MIWYIKTPTKKNFLKYIGSSIDVDIPKSVTLIGDRAFSGRSRLKSIIIPNSVTSIGDYAFYYLKSGSKIYCQSQTVADLLQDGTHYDSSNTTVFVDASKF